jgi:hypothetical protein
MTHRVRLQFTILVSLVGLAAGSCSKPRPLNLSQASPTPPVSVADAGADACTLLTKEEIQAVQGEAFKETKASQKTASGLTVAQCYFELPTPVNSIVLTIMRKAEGGRDPADSWKEIFHREKSQKREEGEEKEPLKVEGIGDEAFWTGTRVGGALYVLKGNCYVRISVGGGGDQAQKMEKSKTLAESVLKRL